MKRSATHPATPRVASQLSSGERSIRALMARMMSAGAKVMHTVEEVSRAIRRAFFFITSLHC